MCDIQRVSGVLHRNGLNVTDQKKGKKKEKKNTKILLAMDLFLLQNPPNTQCWDTAAARKSVQVAEPAHFTRLRKARWRTWKQQRTPVNESSKIFRERETENLVLNKWSNFCT